VSADLLDAQPSVTAALSGSPSAESQQPVESGEEAASPEGKQRGKPAE
jgi:hypothetical protein